MFLSDLRSYSPVTERPQSQLLAEQKKTTFCGISLSFLIPYVPPQSTFISGWRREVLLPGDVGSMLSLPDARLSAKKKKKMPEGQILCVAADKISYLSGLRMFIVALQVCYYCTADALLKEFIFFFRRPSTTAPRKSLSIKR